MSISKRLCFGFGRYRSALRRYCSAFIAMVLSLTLTLIAAPLVARQTPVLLAPAEAPHPLFENLGDHHFPISTDSDLAQQYFDQGLILAYGFNHAEAAQLFQTAATQDPNCAMCYWGLAYVQGPNINAGMDAAAVPTAWQALQRAKSLTLHANAQEQALISALAKRYSPTVTADRTELDLAYANAMRQVHQQYPDNADIAVMFSESLMDTMPWDYWDEQGRAKPKTVELLDTLEAVLADYPYHPGALHLYIHAVEKEYPEKAVEVADRLQGLAPDSGHLVHMPSHIYIRVGRYHDAVSVNQDAIEADNAYLQRPHEPGIYTAAYMPHNHHFKWFGAIMTGQRDIALEAAYATANTDPELMRNPDFAGALQHFYSVPLYTLVRFEQWDDILATPAPAADLKYPMGVWRYARGMAFAAQGNLAQAQQELATVQTIAAEPEMADMLIWTFNSTADILHIAEAVLSGEIAAAQGDYVSAVSALQTAVDLEDQLVYTEPPDWYSPTRNLLGKVLLAANRYPEAEDAFRADLAVYPANGWSLHDLAKSLQAQNKTTEAEEVQAQFEDAWQYADISLEALR